MDACFARPADETVKAKSNHEGKKLEKGTQSCNTVPFQTSVQSGQTKVFEMKQQYSETLFGTANFLVHVIILSEEVTNVFKFFIIAIQNEPMEE
jgi:hypothetical protein